MKKKLFITIPILLVLIVGGSLLASCATTTVTVTTGIPRTATGPPFTTTVTVQPPGGTPVVVTPTFTVPPPDIPHVYFIEDPSNPYIAGAIGESGGAICFECHGNMPTNHEIWIDDPYICGDCHEVSDNPVLIPRTG